jgi:expansin (peptidoglycan-binding protein)
VASYRVRSPARSRITSRTARTRSDRHPDPAITATVSSLEVLDTAGAYTHIARTDYNYFVSTKGLGAGPYTLRVTDTRANVVEDAAIALGDSVSRDGAAQFPMCP